MRSIEMKTWVPAPPEAVFAFSTSLAGFREQFPFRLDWLGGPEQWAHGDVLDFKYRVAGLWFRHRATIVELEPGEAFTDVMERGFFRVFRHRHRFQPHGGGTRVTDAVEFSLGLGDVMDRTVGRALLERTFRRRHDALKHHFSPGAHHASEAVP